MAGGGTAPSSTSRVIPPALPAANERTSTPKISSFLWTPTIAPLSAKTNVPIRSSTSRSVLIQSSRRQWDDASGREPVLRSNDQRLHAGLQRGMEDGREARIVIGREVADPTGRFG